MNEIHLLTVWFSCLWSNRQEKTFYVGHLATNYCTQHQFSPGTKVQELKKKHIEKDPFKTGAAWIKIVTICSSDERGKRVFFPLCLFFRLRLDSEMSPSRKGKMHIWESFLYNTGFLLVMMAGMFGLYFIWEFQHLVLTLKFRLTSAASAWQNQIK